jgi:hypothetical protein
MACNTLIALIGVCSAGPMAGHVTTDAWVQREILANAASLNDVRKHLPDLLFGGGRVVVGVCSIHRSQPLRALSESCLQRGISLDPGPSSCLVLAQIPPIVSKYACDKGGTCGGGCNLMMAQPYAAVSVLCSSLLTVFALVLADVACAAHVICSAKFAPCFDCL